MTSRNGFRHLAIWCTLRANPGLTVGEIARKLNISHSNATSAVLSMENNGFLLSEDGGRLYPWELVRTREA